MVDLSQSLLNWHFISATLVSINITNHIIQFSEIKNHMNQQGFDQSHVMLFHTSHLDFCLVLKSLQFRTLEVLLEKAN